MKKIDLLDRIDMKKIGSGTYLVTFYANNGTYKRELHESHIYDKYQCDELTLHELRWLRNFAKFGAGIAQKR